VGLSGWCSRLAPAEACRRLFWPTQGIVAALLVGALLIKWMERWRKSRDPGKLSAGDQLSHFRELFSRGTISKEEFEQIRARLAGELRKEMKLGPAPEVPVPPDATAGSAPKELTLPQPPGEDAKPG